VTFRPHYLADIGARVFMVIDRPYRTDSTQEALNMDADDARRFADRLKIAACQAEAIGKQHERRRRAAW
jgi:hypothetical protein